MTKAGRYYTMDLHLWPDTALPIWNNKQTGSVFPTSTLDWPACLPACMCVATAAKVERRRPKVCGVPGWSVTQPLLPAGAEVQRVNHSAHGWNN